MNVVHDVNFAMKRFSCMVVEPRGRPLPSEVMPENPRECVFWYGELTNDNPQQVSASTGLPGASQD